MLAYAEISIVVQVLSQVRVRSLGLSEAQFIQVCQDLFTQADLDGDGELNSREFHLLMELCNHQTRPEASVDLSIFETHAIRSDPHAAAFKASVALQTVVGSSADTKFQSESLLAQFGRVATVTAQVVMPLLQQAHANRQLHLGLAVQYQQSVLASLQQHLGEKHVEWIQRWENRMANADILFSGVRVLWLSLLYRRRLHTRIALSIWHSEATRTLAHSGIHIRHDRDVVDSGGISIDIVSDPNRMCSSDVFSWCSP